jgi:putative holliday junction resolvase
MAKVLAIDYGLKKIGLAISDELAMVTAKLPVLHVRRHQDALDGVRYILKETMPNLILIGIPYGSNGEQTQQSKITTDFVEEFKLYIQNESDISSIPIKFWDESFSTQTAEMGKTKKFKREKSDSEAARIFLQEFLDSPERNNIVI